MAYTQGGQSRTGKELGQAVPGGCPPQLQRRGGMPGHMLMDHCLTAQCKGWAVITSPSVHLAISNGGTTRTQGNVGTTMALKTFCLKHPRSIHQAFRTNIQFMRNTRRGSRTHRRQNLLQDQRPGVSATCALRQITTGFAASVISRRPLEGWAWLSLVSCLGCLKPASARLDFHLEPWGKSTSTLIQLVGLISWWSRD